MIKEIRWEKILKHVATVTFRNKRPHVDGRGSLVSNAPSQAFPPLTAAAGGNVDLQKAKDNHRQAIPWRTAIPFPICAEFLTPELPIKLRCYTKVFSWLPIFFLKHHQFDLHVLQTVLLMFAISPNVKGVYGGIFGIIHLCNIGDINLPSSWVPAPKASGLLFIRYYCIKRYRKIIETFTAGSLFLQKTGNLKAIKCVWHNIYYKSHLF